MLVLLTFVFTVNVHGQTGGSSGGTSGGNPPSEIRRGADRTMIDFSGNLYMDFRAGKVVRMKSTCTGAPVSNAGEVNFCYDNTLASRGMYVSMNGGAYVLWTGAGGASSGTVTSISAGTGITLTPNPIVTTGTVSLSTQLTAGSCTNCNITYNAQGQITVAANGSSGGGTVGPGTTNTVAKFTNANTVGDSQITDNGTVIQAGTTAHNVQVQSGYVQLYSQGGESYIGGDNNSIDIDDAGNGIVITSPINGYIVIGRGAGAKIYVDQNVETITHTAANGNRFAATNSPTLSGAGEASFVYNSVDDCLKVSTNASAYACLLSTSNINSLTTLAGDVTGAPNANTVSNLQTNTLTITNPNVSDGSMLAYNGDNLRFEDTWQLRRAGFTPTAPTLGTSTNISTGSDGTQTKSGGVNGTYDAGSISTQTATTFAIAQATVGVTAQAWCIGLDASAASVDCATIDYGIRHNADGTYSTIENGTVQSTSTTAAKPGDVLLVQIIGGKVRYAIADLVFRVSSVAPSGTYKMVTSIATASGIINEPKLYNGSGGSGFFSPAQAPDINWTRFGMFAAFKDRSVDPVTPASGEKFLYGKSDGLYYKDSSGNIHPIGAIETSIVGACSNNQIAVSGGKLYICSGGTFIQYGIDTVQDEGSALTLRNKINFTGAGVTCVDNAGSTRTDCTIAGGSISGLTTGRLTKATSATAIGDSLVSETSGDIQLNSSARLLFSGGALTGRINYDGVNFNLEQTATGAGVDVRANSFSARTSGTNQATLDLTGFAVGAGTGGYCFNSVSGAGTGYGCLNSNGATASFKLTGAAGSGFGDLKVRQYYADATNTATGTTGNQTINKSAGTVNVAASGTTITVTNSLVTANSLVYAIARTNDATCAVKNAVPAAGSVVINMTAACTAETSVGFLVVNQ